MNALVSLQVRGGRWSAPLLWLAVLALVHGAALHAQNPAPEPTFAANDYRIAPRDQLQFQIFEEPDSLLVQRVSSAGEISVPMLGSVRVAGLTLRQAEQMMEERYRKDGYFLKPQVILSFQAYAPRSVSVLGQVNRPEQIEFPIERGEIGIVSAITRAGGFTRVARTDQVRVMRFVGGEERSFIVNVAQYLDERTPTQKEFRLQPDDIVFVPERVF